MIKYPISLFGALLVVAGASYQKVLVSDLAFRCYEFISHLLEAIFEQVYSFGNVIYESYLHLEISVSQENESDWSRFSKNWNKIIMACDGDLGIQSPRKSQLG